MKVKKLKVSKTKKGKLRLDNCCPIRDSWFVIAILERYFDDGEDALSGLNRPKEQAFASWEKLSEILCWEKEQLTVWFYFNESRTDSEMEWKFS